MTPEMMAASKRTRGSLADGIDGIDRLALTDGSSKTMLLATPSIPGSKLECHVPDPLPVGVVFVSNHHSPVRSHVLPSSGSD